MWFASFSLIFGCSPKKPPQIYHLLKQKTSHPSAVRPEVGKFEQPGDVTSSWLGGTGRVGWHRLTGRWVFTNLSAMMVVGLKWSNSYERILLNYLGDIFTFRKKTDGFHVGFIRSCYWMCMECGAKLRFIYMIRESELMNIAPGIRWYHPKKADQVFGKTSPNRIHTGVEPKNRGGSKPPKSSHFNRDFHYFHHPFWGKPPIFGNTHTESCTHESRWNL